MSGALGGMTRLRRFHQDDAHIFCREDQVGQEIDGCLQFIKEVYDVFGLEPSFRLSTRPDKFVGSPETWDAAESALQQVRKKNPAQPCRFVFSSHAPWSVSVPIRLIVERGQCLLFRKNMCGGELMLVPTSHGVCLPRSLLVVEKKKCSVAFWMSCGAPIVLPKIVDHLHTTPSSSQSLDTVGLPWELNPGDGAFYGPKIDCVVTDALQRQHQCATIQLDFQLPQRFNLRYQTAEGNKQYPVMIHRAILGSLERFLAILTEHVGGKWPFWISPRQVLVVPVSSARHMDRADEVCWRMLCAQLEYDPVSCHWQVICVSFTHPQTSTLFHELLVQFSVFCTRVRKWHGMGHLSFHLRMMTLVFPYRFAPYCMRMDITWNWIPATIHCQRKFEMPRLWVSAVV